MRNLAILSMAFAVLALAACSSGTCGDPVYKGPHCPPKVDIPGVPYPGSPACNPTVGAAPCAPPVAAAPALPDVSHCGEYPAEAKPGEVWCCDWVQPPAAPPVLVEVAPARVEWQRVPCGDGSGDCWALVTVPPVSETRVSAPPPGHYEWRRHNECEKPSP